MVGVPHSTGCALCRERRIKCDQAIPDCTQCRRYGRPCPGYRKTYRFQDERPGLERKHRSSSTTTSSPRDPSTASPPTINTTPPMQRNPAELANDTDDDSNNQRLLFVEFLATAFPTGWAHVGTRLMANEGEDASRLQAQTARLCGGHGFQATATACLTGIYVARARGSAGMEGTSRRLYARALREVERGLDCAETAMSGVMVGAVMMLAVYEMYARTSVDAFVVHVEGVERVMCERGARAHERGLARSCYLAFRGLLVATAIFEGRGCFLEGEEWVRLARRVGEEDSRRCGGGWGRFVMMYEEVFAQVVRVPGYLEEARRVRSESAERDLVRRMRETRAQLRELVAAMDGWAGSSGRDSAPSLLVWGAGSAVALLDALLGRLRVQAGPLRFRVVTELGRGGESLTWLDRVASSMGMLGTEIVF
ncbi:hypothetical protein P168DRAFT_319853 [Aspergillus campestris IBT 28561]|uniref:Zn(2)-C6 fungal-type domain-containing protein n=1 Tax=Aspergillus campestris (strain IBT 28561) TaxID=1392248 RepID=A0A2I1D0C4_ASPC2|nr:uncharacterized protein P168DRAFT_319853 [Aspergillus campestris IBT 28561]PKY03324.1 hypothetical protein P168DRAFT_319853 [Aspergillus campestris IBT 28561]